jgi:hypothetical protein
VNTQLVNAAQQRLSDSGVRVIGAAGGVGGDREMALSVDHPGKPHPKDLFKPGEVRHVTLTVARLGRRMQILEEVEQPGLLPLHAHRRCANDLARGKAAIRPVLNQSQQRMHVLPPAAVTGQRPEQ